MAEQPSHTDGNSFAYFAWHRMKFPSCPPFSPTCHWRIAAWTLGLRGKDQYRPDAVLPDDPETLQK